MLGKKEDLTPEEYRQQVQNQMDDLKAKWKTFFRTGFIMLAAVIAIIAICIAWFVSNNRVDATGGTIQAAEGKFDLAAAVENETSAVGEYDNYLEVSQGAQKTISSKDFLSTDGGHTSISWAITDDSQMGNKKGQGKGKGIEPGSSGSMTFYIVPHEDGPLDVTLNLTLIGYTADDDAKLKKIEENDQAQQLLEGHVLLFAGYDEASNSYSGWISEDAETWSMSLSSENGISLSRGENGELTWKIENATKETVYPVTVYWIWPEILGSYLTKDHSNIGKRPVLFPADWNKDSENHLTELPAALYKTMCENSGTSNRYFYWKNDENFSDTVTEEKLSLMRTNFNPVIYGTLAVYYNQGDEYLGKHVRYVKLKLEAQ